MKSHHRVDRYDELNTDQFREVRGECRRAVAGPSGSVSHFVFSCWPIRISSHAIRVRIFFVSRCFTNNYIHFVFVLLFLLITITRHFCRRCYCPFRFLFIGIINECKLQLYTVGTLARVSFRHYIPLHYLLCAQLTGSTLANHPSFRTVRITTCLDHSYRRVTVK